MISRHEYSALRPDHPNWIRLDKMQKELLLFHLQLLNYALLRGYSYLRWQTVVNAMLWKDPGNIKIHRTRVIHLYEADYNLALSLKWREALFESERSRTLVEGQYGSRPRKNSQDPVLLEVLQTEVSRLTRKSLVLMNFDATSCYDRIIPNLANMASRKYGVPATVAQMNSVTLERNHYRLRTGLGTSTSGYSHSHDSPIYGIGQGSGNASIVWSFLWCILYECYEAQVRGAAYELPNRTSQMLLKMIGFVDDNNGQCNEFLKDFQAPLEELLQRAKHEMTVWRDILRASGGDLELPKCSYQIMHWGFTIEGGPILAGGCNGSPILIPDDNEDGYTQIPQLSAHSAHKTLGHYMTPAGNQKRQQSELMMRSHNIALKLASSGLSRSEVWTYYFTTYLPSLGHTLPMNHFTRNQLQNIQRKALSGIIARSGYNRNTHRAIIFGSTTYGGANFRHLYSIQGAGQVQMFLKYWRTPNTQIGQLLRICVAWFQLSAGVSYPVFEEVNLSLDYTDSLWLLSMREFLKTVRGSITLQPTYVPELERQHDTFIMDAVIASEWFTPREVKRVNWCRLYLQVTLISDITNVAGSHLDPNMIKGIVDHPKSSVTAGHRFVQDRPAQRVWSLWRKANLLWSNEHG